MEGGDFANLRVLITVYASSSLYYIRYIFCCQYRFALPVTACASHLMLVTNSSQSDEFVKKKRTQFVFDSKNIIFIFVRKLQLTLDIPV